MVFPLKMVDLSIVFFSFSIEKTHRSQGRRDREPLAAERADAHGHLPIGFRRGETRVQKKRSSWGEILGLPVPICWLMGWWWVNDGLMMGWWWVDDGLMMDSWWVDDGWWWLMMDWWWVDDGLMMVEDGLRMGWWWVDDGWWWIDDGLMMVDDGWWWVDDGMMGRWWDYPGVNWHGRPGNVWYSNPKNCDLMGL